MALYNLQKTCILMIGPSRKVRHSCVSLQIRKMIFPRSHAYKMTFRPNNSENSVLPGRCLCLPGFFFKFLILLSFSAIEIYNEHYFNILLFMLVMYICSKSVLFRFSSFLQIFNSKLKYIVNALGYAVEECLIHITITTNKKKKLKQLH